MQGWIKLHRKLIEWEWYKNPHMVHLFIHLLLSANHEPNRWQGIDIERGQVVTGLKALNASTGISTQTLRTCLSRLEKSGNLTSKSTNKFRIITLCNYETYQLREADTNKPANKQLTINQQSTNKQLTPNKNVKKDENEKNANKNTLAYEIMRYWNNKSNLPNVRILTPKRLTQIQTRLAEATFNSDWQKIIDKISSSDFCTGSTGWKATFDWFVKNQDNYIKVLEGNYGSESGDKDCVDCGAGFVAGEDGHKFSSIDPATQKKLFKCKECRSAK